MPNKKTNKKAPQKNSSAKGVFSKVMKALKPSPGKKASPKSSKQKVHVKHAVAKSSVKTAAKPAQKNAQKPVQVAHKLAKGQKKSIPSNKNTAPVSKKAKGFQKLETLKHKPVVAHPVKGSNAQPKAIKGKAVPPPPAPVLPAKDLKVAKVKAGKAGKSAPADAGSKKAAVNPAVARALLREKKRCREPGCEHDFTMANYCRLHYIKNWRKIKRKEAILASGQLENYVEELVSKYPDKYLDVIQQDLSSEKDWAKVVLDLELESPDDEFAGEEEGEAFAEGAPRSARDFEDEEPESF